MAQTKASTTATKAKEDTTKMNVFQKLLLARAKFLEADVQKTGKNMHLSFKYFELDDIVPPATRIFSEVGLVPIVNFTTDTATMTLYNTDAPEENPITFSAPFNQIEPIISNTGKQATNSMQALGSSITYMRRYLYMIVLDICESDGIEPTIDNTTNKPENAPAPAPTQHAPATPEQREEVKQTLTNTEGNATELQLKQLKAAMKKLREKDPSKEDVISQIAIETKGFTTITKSDCEKIMNKVGEWLKEGADNE